MPGFRPQPVGGRSVTAATVSPPAGEIAAIVRALKLNYPIETPDVFIAQVAASGPSVRFRGEDYDATAAAKLLPTFYFPLTSEEDLVAKAVELLIARGLLPLPSNA